VGSLVVVLREIPAGKGGEGGVKRGGGGKSPGGGGKGGGRAWDQAGGWILPQEVVGRKDEKGFHHEREP